MELFWKKKTLVSFVLSIFVFWIHIASFGQYQLTSGQGADSGAGMFIQCLSLFFTNTFVRMAVPLFFILAGAANFRNYDNKKYVSKLKTRFWSLLLPYLIWNTLGMLFEIATSYTFVSRYFLAREKFVISVPNILKGIFLYGCNGPFWFICALIVFVILSPVFDLLTKTKVSSFITLAVFIVISGLEIPGFLSWLHVNESLVYYTVGCILGRHFMNRFSESYGKRASIGAVCVFIICTAVWFIRGMGIFELPVSLSIVFLSVYALSFWYAADIIDIKAVRLRPFMDDSFFIYAMHINLSAIIVKLLYTAMPKSILWSIPNFIITTVLTLVIILLFAAFLRKRLNTVYLFLSGKAKRKAG